MRLKNLILPLSLFALVALLSPANSLAAGKGFYPDGKLQWEYLFQEGQISEAKWFNEDGKLQSREIYVDGKPETTEGYREDGTLEWQVKNLETGRQDVTRYDPSGQVTARYQVLNDKPDGEYSIYYEDGKIKQTVTYKDGILNGPARTFFPSGQVEHEFSYLNGEVDGTYKTYSEEGTLLTEYTFSAGRLQ